MIKSQHAPFDTVFVVGGTHGNERTGVTLVQHWRQSPAEIKRATFDTRLLLANPEAIRQNIRFIDCDLNRSFIAPPRVEGSKCYEIGRAREVAAEMRLGQVGKRIFAIDLHTSTARMGVTLITNSDPVNLAIAAEVQSDLKDARIYCFADSDRINTCLRAAADGGLGVEIGPIPQGLVRHDTLDTTRDVVQRILNAVERFNRGGILPPEASRTIFLHDRNVSYPAVPPGAPPAFIHRDLQGQDYAPLQTGKPVFQNLAGRIWLYEAAETRYPVFINEAAYYSENLAFSLTRKVPWASLSVPG